MAVIVRRRSCGGVLPLGRHASISGFSFVHSASPSIASPHSGGGKRPHTEPVQGRTGRSCPFVQRHIFDASDAPRGQLPYIVDDGTPIGDSDAIIAHLSRTYDLKLDDALNAQQRDTGLLVTRMLDDLYWVM